MDTSSLPHIVVSLSEIMSWPSYFLANKLTSKLPPEQDEKLFKLNHNVNDKISLWQGDITRLGVDAIVNAANSELEPGGGVCGSLHAGAGPKLAEECAQLVTESGACPAGEARITGGYKLPAKHVIQAVGPQGEAPRTLRETYDSCFQILLEKGVRTIAFPCISTGIYGYPDEAASHIALRTTRHFLEEHHERVDRVVFAVFFEKDRLIYEELMQRYFPVTE